MCGYTQEDMPSLIGCSSREMYSYKENGKYKFSNDEMKKIYRLFKKKIPSIKMEDLFPDEIS